MQTATFGAGCFWGVEEEFARLSGVQNTRVGYMGGTKVDPTYEEVCTGQTGHAEVVQVNYDPEQISYDQLLDTFFSLHDPTMLNRQGPDIGTQYRSVVFTHDESQKKQSLNKKMELDQSTTYNKPIVTEIIPAQSFYQAEEYHQRYLQKRSLRSCHR